MISMLEPTARDISRFLEKVDIKGPDECWPWLASTNHSGYGKFGFGGAGAGWVAASRMTYRIFYNRWPERYACHTCDNPPCCNPAHLYDGTPAQNQGDAWQRGRHVRGPGWKQGTKNGSAKLTEEAVRVIRATPAGYGTIKALCRRYGVSMPTVQDVRRGKTWKHVH